MDQRTTIDGYQNIAPPNQARKLRRACPPIGQTVETLDDDMTTQYGQLEAEASIARQVVIVLLLDWLTVRLLCSRINNSINIGAITKFGMEMPSMATPINE